MYGMNELDEYGKIELENKYYELERENTELNLAYKELLERYEELEKKYNRVIMDKYTDKIIDNMHFYKNKEGTVYGSSKPDKREGFQEIIDGIELKKVRDIFKKVIKEDYLFDEMLDLKEEVEEDED